MELDAYLVYYTADDCSDINHKVFIDPVEASDYAISLANKMTGQSFTGFHQMMEWFNQPLDNYVVDPGMIKFVEVKVHKNT